MAEQKLNTTTSIVDFLKSAGKASDFNSRRALYASSGLETRLGSYTGSSSQNQALLKITQEQNKEAATPASITGAATATPPAPFGANEVYQQLINAGAPKEQAEHAVSLIPGQEGQKPPTTPPPTVDSGLPGASDVLDIFGYAPPSEEDILNKVFNSPAYKVLEEKLGADLAYQKATAAAKKETLDKTYEAEKKSLENKLAARGLTFSGLKGVAIKDLADSLAASQLEVDRDLAKFLLDADIDLRESVMDMVADTMKDADSGREEAIKQLNEAGYAIVGGKLVPTLAHLREIRIAEDAEIRLGQAEERLQQAEERFVFSAEMSEARLTIAEERLALAQAKASEPDSDLSKGDKSAIAFDDVKRRAGAKLLNIAKESGDGFTNPNEFIKFRNEVLSKTPTYLDDFDNLFAILLNPADARYLGIVQPDPFEVERQRLFRKQ